MCEGVRRKALSRVVCKSREKALRDALVSLPAPRRRSCHCHVDASNVALSLKRRLIEEREFVIIKWKWLKSRRHDLVTGH